MITEVTLTTFDSKYFKLDFRRTERDITGTYELIRYELPDDADIWNAVANNWVNIHMTQYKYMNPNFVMGGIDLETINTEKIVTDVSETLQFHDAIIDNTTVDPDKVYAYILYADEFGRKYTTPYVTGYIELSVDSYTETIRPTHTLDWLKHRGVPDVELLNGHFDAIFGDLIYLEESGDSIAERHDSIIDNIKVKDLLDKLEQVLGIYEMLQLSNPKGTVTQRLGWGVSQFGVDGFGFGEVVFQLGFPYDFG